VAKLAGLPPAVIARARAILRTLEAPGGGVPTADLPRPVVPGAAEAGVGQLGLFSPSGGPTLAQTPEDQALKEILDRLRAVDPDELSPRAAHELLSELVRKLTAQP
jgi:DNA mismatch repair protein MutS